MLLDVPGGTYWRGFTTFVQDELARRGLVAEDDRNHPALVEQTGFSGVWADDFHHAVHVTLTGERDGYYASYEPGAATIARAIKQGWLYEGQPYPATGKPRGAPAPSRLS